MIQLLPRPPSEFATDPIYTQVCSREGSLDRRGSPLKLPDGIKDSLTCRKLLAGVQGRSGNAPLDLPQVLTDLHEILQDIRLGVFLVTIVRHENWKVDVYHGNPLAHVRRIPSKHMRWK
jgi:hypothetical protein